MRQQNICGLNVTVQYPCVPNVSGYAGCIAEACACLARQWLCRAYLPHGTLQALSVSAERGFSALPQVKVASYVV